jgi:tetratricopeptide (TPR) repeat protein
LAIALAEIALNSGQFETAQGLFEVAMAADTGFARSYSGLGDALRMQELDGMDQTVSSYFDRALALAPENALIQLDHGEYWESELLDCEKVWPAAQRRQILADMQSRFTQALALAPDSPEANLAMAQLYLFSEMDWQQGVSYQQRAFALLPAETFVMEQAVRYAIAADKYDEAERLIEELAQPIHFWGEQQWVTALRERLLKKRRNEPYDACAN